MSRINDRFFAGLEDDEFEDMTDIVDQNLDDDGEIEPVITETDVPEDGKPGSVDNSEVVSTEDFNYFFNRGFEDDEELVGEMEGDAVETEEPETDTTADAPVVNVHVDVETGDVDEGVEGYFFGFEDGEDPVDEAAELSEGEDTGEGDDVAEDDTAAEEPEETDVGVDINVNVHVDDGTDGSDEPETPATEEISQEDFNSIMFGFEDNEDPVVNVEVTVNGETEETVTTEDEGDEIVDSDDPVDQAAALSDDQTVEPEETGTEEDDDDFDEGTESFFSDLF